MSVTLSKVPKPVRDDALPHGLGCDHRAAWSLSDVFRLLTTRNIADDVAGFVGDTYPRACVYHHVDGTRWFCYLEAPDQEFTLQQVQYDRPPEAPVPLSQWCPP